MAETSSVAAAASGAFTNLLSALPGVGADVLAAKTAQKAAEIAASTAKSQAKTAQAQAAAEKSKTEQLSMLQRVGTTAKNPWVIGGLVVAAGVAAWLLLRKKS